MPGDTETFRKLNQSQGSFMERLLFWKLAAAKAANKALIALFISLAASLNGAEWALFTPTQKFVAIGSAVVAMCNVIDAFLNDTMSKLNAQAEVERKSQVAIETGIVETENQRSKK